MPNNDRTEITQARQALLDALPHMVFVVDEDLQILMANAVGLAAVGGNFNNIYNQRTGQAFSCLHAHETPGGCGRGTACQDCVIRNGVNAAFRGDKAYRHRTKMVLKTPQGTEEVYIRVTAGTMEFDGRKRVLLTLEDVSDVIDIKGMVPICSHCKKIRVESQFWERLEIFFNKRLEVNFTHGLCPECMEQYFPGMGAEEDTQPANAAQSAK